MRRTLLACVLVFFPVAMAHFHVLLTAFPNSKCALITVHMQPIRGLIIYSSKDADSCTEGMRHYIKFKRGLIRVYVTAKPFCSGLQTLPVWDYVLYFCLEH